MNWKGFGRKRLRPNLKYYSVISLKGLADGMRNVTHLTATFSVMLLIPTISIYQHAIRNGYQHNVFIASGLWVKQIFCPSSRDW
jgi:hypothetical protein